MLGRKGAPANVRYLLAFEAQLLPPKPHFGLGKAVQGSKEHLIAYSLLIIWNMAR